jgi:acyl-CoA thioesterase YciA
MDTPNTTFPRNLSIRRILLTRDTNHRGEVFGGAILAEIDLAGVVEARKHTKHDLATVFVNGVEFKHPVHVGDVVSFYTSLVRIGKTSITVRVEIEASRDGADAVVAVTATEIVYVAIERDSSGNLHKVPVDSPINS